MSRYRAPNDSEGLQSVPRDSRGLHVVSDEDTRKEAYNQAGLQPDDYSKLIAARDTKSAPPPVYYDNKFGTQIEAAPLKDQPQPAPRRWWARKRFILILVAAVVVGLALVIAVPVALTVGKHGGASSTSSSPDLATPPNTNTPSTSGAFNGTGLATLIPGDSSDGEAIVFYQHFDGSLRQSILLNGAWSGGNEPILAQDNVRNGTPIGTWQYKVGSDEIWHVVWVDQKNILQDLTKTNASGSWTPGKLSDGNFEASTSSATSLSMGRFNIFNEGKPISGLGTIRVFFGDTQGIVKELSLADDATSWNVSHVFPENVNGHGGFSAAVPSGLAFMFYTDKAQNSLGYYYQEQDIGQGDLPFSNGDWTSSATMAATTLRNSSAVSWLSAQFATFQAPSNDIITIKPSFSKPSGPWGSSQKVGAGLPGTRIVSAMPKSDTGKGPLLFFQETGDDIIQYEQNTKDLSWSKSPVAVD